MDDDSDKITILDIEVNDSEGITLRQLKQFKKNILDAAITTIQNQNTRITVLETFRTNAISKSTDLEARIAALESP